MFVDIVTAIIIVASLGAGAWIIRRSYPNLRIPGFSVFR